jgi:hypothetical protein
MNTKKLVTLLSIYFLSSTAIIQTMENKKLDDLFFSNNNNSSMQIQSVINRREKYTDLIISNVNGGIINIYSTEIKANASSPKTTGICFNCLNTLGTLLAFIQINNKQAVLIEPRLEIQNLIENSETGDSFELVSNMSTTKSTIDLTGNETWDNFTIHFNRTSLATTGFQRCIIRLKHES